MKVLVISDNKNTVDFFDSYLNERHYDVIVYQWLIKAIDNIEEIKPDVVIVSSAEYPRHWKTLASFVQSGIGGESVKLFLYEPDPLSEDELNKAKTLGVEGCLSSLDEKSLDKYFPVLENAGDIGKKSKTRQIILTNPKDGGLLSGQILCEEDNIIQCKITTDDLENGELIKNVSVYSNGKVSFLSADVKEINKETGTLSLSVCEYYEEV